VESILVVDREVSVLRFGDHRVDLLYPWRERDPDGSLIGVLLDDALE